MSVANAGKISARRTVPMLLAEIASSSEVAPRIAVRIIASEISGRIAILDGKHLVAAEVPASGLTGQDALDALMAVDKAMYHIIVLDEADLAQVGQNLQQPIMRAGVRSASMTQQLQALKSTATNILSTAVQAASVVEPIKALQSTATRLMARLRMKQAAMPFEERKQAPGESASMLDFQRPATKTYAIAVACACALLIFCAAVQAYICLDAQTRLKAGEVALQNKDASTALQQYEAVIHEDPHNVPAYIGRGSAFCMMDKHKDACADFAFALALQPDNPQALIGRAASNIQLSNMESASADLDKLIAANQLKPEALWLRALLNCRKQKYAECVGDCDELLKLRESEEAHKVRSFALFKSEKYAEAIPDLTYLIEKSKNNGPYLMRGVAFYRTGKYPDAIADFSVVIDENPRSHTALYNRGLAYQAEKEWNKAIDDYTTLLSHKSQSYDALYQRGLCEMQLNEPGKAISDFEKAWAIKPGDQALKQALSTAMTRARKT